MCLAGDIGVVHGGYIGNSAWHVGGWAHAMAPVLLVNMHALARLISWFACGKCRATAFLSTYSMQ